MVLPLLDADKSTLPTLRLDKLRSGDKDESKKIYQACHVHGFFYLDLTSDPELVAEWENLLTAMREYFEQPLDVKMRDARGSDNHGYAVDTGPYRSLM